MQDTTHKQTEAKFDPYQPARLIAEALGYAIYKQSGICWIYNKFTQASALCQEPDPWHSAQWVFENQSNLVA